MASNQLARGPALLTPARAAPFDCTRARSRDSAKRPERRPQVSRQQLRLFPRGEVAAHVVEQITASVADNRALNSWVESAGGRHSENFRFS